VNFAFTHISAKQNQKVTREEEKKSKKAKVKMDSTFAFLLFRFDLHSQLLFNVNQG